MQTIDHVKYVKELRIQTLGASFPVSKGDEVKTTDDVEQSFLNAKSLVSFVSELSSQRRDDVLNSVLLAQLAANKQFPNEEQMLEWYKAFAAVLNNLGWTIEDSQISTFSSNTEIFELENAIIDILTTAFGGNFVTVITKTLNAIKKLGEDNGKIKAFEKNTHSLSKGAFQIGVAKEENTTVALQLGTFLLTSTNTIKRILFFKAEKNKSKLEYYSRKATLNEVVYSKIRQAVLDKLGGKATDFIAEIEI